MLRVRYLNKGCRIWPQRHLSGQRLGLDWGLQSQFPPFRYFFHIPSLSKQTLAIGYQVYIWQVSPQLSCSDTCQILMWSQESNRYTFCKIKNFADEEVNERSFCNPHRRSYGGRRWGCDKTASTPQDCRGMAHGWVGIINYMEFVVKQTKLSKYLMWMNGISFESRDTTRCWFRYRKTRYIIHEICTEFCCAFGHYVYIGLLGQCMWFIQPYCFVVTSVVQGQ